MRLGMLGGTFNPIHYGHIRLAKRAQRAFSLDKCLLMVANHPPHKNVAGNIPADMRLDMVKAAIESECCPDRIEASGLEIELGGASFTVNTLYALQEKYPSAQISIIVGADMLFNMPHWRSPNEIFKLADTIAVMRKGGPSPVSAKLAIRRLSKMARELRESFGARVHIADFTAPDISSSAIRENIFSATPIEGLTPYAVERIIYENALYQPEHISDLIKALDRSLNRKRLIHSISTMREAIALARRYGANAEKCRLAALLHDCAKINGTDYIREAESLGIAIDAYEREAPSLLHAKLGAYKAMHEYRIEDGEILRAIESHTLCRNGMTDVEKIVYIADKIEALRDYPGVEGLRGAAKRGLKEGLLACMDFSISHLKEARANMHPGILEAREYILEHD